MIARRERVSFGGASLFAPRESFGHDGNPYVALRHGRSLCDSAPVPDRIVRRVACRGVVCRSCLRMDRTRCLSWNGGQTLITRSSSV